MWGYIDMSHYFLTMSYFSGQNTTIRYKSFTNYVNTTTGASSSRIIPTGTVNDDIVLVFYVKENLFCCAHYLLFQKLVFVDFWFYFIS